MPVPALPYASQFDALHPKLIAFALLQASDRGHAEDIVQSLCKKRHTENLYNDKALT
ncbi:hypothetical protein [Neptunomonas japonica]|uniref:hypothetical protein n=1 Tax=Neptunomonas japonica TaxID=417574 RepID=UPI00041B284E|nr:hypothetical protein [Neptunomonas japonica]